MLRRFHWLPFILVAFGLLASAAALNHRFQVERRSRAVSLTLDYQQLRNFLAAAGVPESRAYHDFEAAGVTAVAVSEETLDSLLSAGLVEVTREPTPTGVETRVDIADPVLAARVSEFVRHLVPSASDQPPAGDRVVFPGPVYVLGQLEDFRGLPVGLDPQVVERVRAAGLNVVGRVNNYLGLTEQSLRWRLERLREQGALMLIFAGEEVLGYRGLLPETAELMRELGMVYGSVEFGKQRGDETLSRLLTDRLVRVHSISAGEMVRLTPGEAVERYVRAAVERNIRLLYVRLPGVVSRDVYGGSLDYVRSLARSVAGSGFGLAEPVAFVPVWEDPTARRIAHGLIGAGIGAGAVLLLIGLIPATPAARLRLTLLVALAAAALGASGVARAQQMLALLAAIVFPTLAFVLFPQPTGAFTEHQHAAVARRDKVAVPTLAEFATISAVTLAGAALVAGLLSELPYLVKIQAFAGVKAATLLPILLVGWIYLTGMTNLYRSWAEEREEMGRRLRAVLFENVRVWHLLASGLGLVLVLILLTRTGNESLVGVSALELRFRSLLDRVLGIRPRTKEFLIGHPALILALAWMAFPAGRRIALPLMLVGVIGQVGMLNSFCHLHTPLKVTVIRTFNGLWVGALIGFLLVAAWFWGLRLWERRRLRS